VLALWRPLTPVAKVLLVIVAVYSAVHLGYSGIWRPWQDHVIIQTGQEMRPLQAYFQTGRPVTLDPDNPRQYGPTYLFLMHPILRWFGGPDPAHLNPDDPAQLPAARSLSRALFVTDLISLILAGWFVIASIRVRLLRPANVGAARSAIVIVGLVVLWTNYSPVYEALTEKTVEIWELGLIAAAMYAALSDRPFWSGFCLAAATLMKMLPGFLFVLLLLRDRRAFLYGCAWIAVFLCAGHLLYGPELGLGYVWLPFKAVSGHTIGFTGVDNLSFKGLIAKSLGHLIPRAPGGPFADGDPRSGLYVALTPFQVNFANRLGDLMSVVLVVWMLWALIRLGRRRATPYTDLWAWAFADLIMLVVTPLIGYEYTTLVLPAFSVACALAIAYPASVGRTVITQLACAIFLVANIIPRQVVNRIIPVAMFGRLSGYSHMPPTKLYSYYCFVTLGLLLLVSVLWEMRPDAADPPAGFFPNGAATSMESALL
jgi:hypothetical protein